MTIAVIIPVLNLSELLAKTLRALTSGTRVPDELIVVDDGSTDTSAEIARMFGARVIVMQTNAGPSVCRNEAALQAESTILVFLDADTCVHQDTLQRMEVCLNDPTLTAVIGSYDDAPSDSGFCSQYRNLAHCYVHRTSKREALTFWTGCGAIRRTAFLQAGGFNERFRRPSIEDIELGYQLSDCGARILLDPEICVTHTKRWTLWNSIVTDISDRGAPWMSLLLDRRTLPNDLNITLHHRFAAALTGLSLFSLIACFWSIGWLVPAALLMAAALGTEAGMLRFLYEHRGFKFLMFSAAMILLQNLCKIFAVLIALSMFVARWLPWRRRLLAERTSRISLLYAKSREALTAE